MAMTKKETAAMDALIYELRVTAALRWTDAVEADIPKPEPFTGEVSGYSFNARSSRVEESWSEGAFHGIGYRSRAEQRARGGSGSQNGINQYSTRVLAFKAMRNAVERDCAEKLAKIDEQLARLK